MSLIVCHINRYENVNFVMKWDVLLSPLDLAVRYMDLTVKMGLGQLSGLWQTGPIQVLDC